ncbi:hypothetical protein ACFE04_000939 [Oxalis oulophora]
MQGRRVRRYRSNRCESHSQVNNNLTIDNDTINTQNCLYCQFKFSTTKLNQTLSDIGASYPTFFNSWFSIGVGFSFTALLTVTLILLWELATALRILRGDTGAHHVIGNLLFGFSPSVYGFSISLVDSGYLLISTLISVFIHEFGHALAAASEGMQMEYIAVFLACLFPGALVAFDYDLLQALPRFTSLRVYCAGIWHNAVCCAVCALVLFLLPFILFPFYINGGSPMVLNVPSSSPLSGYLSPGDQILSLDGAQIHHAQEWMDTAAYINRLSLDSLHSFNQSTYSKDSGTNYYKKGYCVPDSMKDQSNKFVLRDEQPICEGYVPVFVETHCLDSSKIDDASSDDGRPGKQEYGYCLNPKDVVKLHKCGYGWITTNESSCICSQDESCLSPLQLPGLTWVEITYSSPKCVNLASNSLLPSNTSETIENKCGGTFVFVGDVISMAVSIRLTSYQPRWTYPFAERLPNVMEKLLVCTFHVSLTLALLNSLPTEPGSQTEQPPPSDVFWMTLEDMRGFKFMILVILFAMQHQGTDKGGSLFPFVKIVSQAAPRNGQWYNCLGSIGNPGNAGILVLLAVVLAFLAQWFY